MTGEEKLKCISNDSHIGPGLFFESLPTAAVNLAPSLARVWPMSDWWCHIPSVLVEILAWHLHQGQMLRTCLPNKALLGGELEPMERVVTGHDGGIGNVRVEAWTWILRSLYRIRPLALVAQCLLQCRLPDAHLYEMSHSCKGSRMTLISFSRTAAAVLQLNYLFYWYCPPF